MSGDGDIQTCDVQYHVSGIRCRRKVDKTRKQYEGWNKRGREEGEIKDKKKKTLEANGNRATK